MQEGEYTFVTVDTDDATWADAVVVDVNDDNALMGVVVLDESMDSQDFITLSDETIMLSDADMFDLSSADFDMDGLDITILL